MSNDPAADERLDKVAGKLITQGLHVRVPIDGPLSPGDPDADSIWVHNPASGQYAQISYAGPDGNGDFCLELTYRTDPDQDPDGAHMTERVVRLLSASPLRGRLAIAAFGKRWRRN